MSYLETSSSFSQVRPTEASAVQVAGYQPQAGDIILFDSKSSVMKGLYLLAGTKLPDHAAIVVNRPDGRLALLEAGPIPNFSVHMEDVMTRLRGFTGQIWIRRFSGTLTPQQNQKLTQFAVAQTGKRYSLARFIMCGTPFSARRLLRPFATTHTNRASWLCSELVISALTAANLLSPETVPATAVFPRDIAANDRYDFNRLWAGAMLWRASAPMVRSPRRVPSGPVARPFPRAASAGAARAAHA